MVEHPDLLYVLLSQLSQNISSAVIMAMGLEYKCIKLIHNSFDKTFLPS